MLSQIQLTVTPQTVAHQDPLSMRFCRQERVEWVAMPYSRGSSRPKIKLTQLVSPTQARRFFTTVTILSVYIPINSEMHLLLILCIGNVFSTSKYN